MEQYLITHLTKGTIKGKYRSLHNCEQNLVLTIIEEIQFSQVIKDLIKTT